MIDFKKTTPNKAKLFPLNLKQQPINNHFKFLIVLTVILSVIIFAIFNSFVPRHNISYIPRDVLFGNPDKTSVKLSYDGKYISYLAPKDGVLNIWLAPINDLSKAKPITDDKARGIRQYSWSFDNEHILYMKDTKGNENHRLYSYSLKTNVVTLLTPETGVKTRIYKKSKLAPNEILIGLNERDKRYFDVYKLNLTNYSKELVLKNDKFTSFVIDDNLKIRFAFLSNEENGTEYFEQKNGNWELFMKIAAEDVKTTHFVGFNKTGSIAYLLDSRGSNTAALKTLNLDTGELITIAEDQRADVWVFTSHPGEKNIQAITVNYDKKTYKILDDSIKADIEYLKSVNPGDFTILARVADDKIWLVSYANDTGPVKYYIYDRSKHKVEFLFTNKKDLENYTMSPMTPVIIKSRDGLDLVSYITLPAEINPNVGPTEPLPLVLLVHGGPWRRDRFGFNPQHQWLASRGYAALSVNFRGSTGFGKNFLNAGNMEWGGKMHDDLIDAVNWAIENKIADPKKVCIMGASYGGYAALVGLTFTPDIFACGIDTVGPTNILTLVNSVPPYWKPILSNYKKRVGAWDTEEERDFLKQRSPLTFAEKIKKPLLIVQGAHDPRVTQAESDQIVKAMQKHNIPVIYALYNDEGHGLVRPANKLSFYAITEHFLAGILGGKVEPVGEALKGANFTLNGKENIDNNEVEKIINQIVSSFSKN
jgi:dipeptidyl aminopeptidase/acylaminoacyl peptidase